MMLRAGAAHAGIMETHVVETLYSPAVTQPFAHPADSSASVFSVICAQNLEEDVGVGSVVSELQETGEAAHPELQGEENNNTHMMTFNFSLTGSLSVKDTLIPACTF